MPWQFFLGLGLGAVAFGAVGFALGRLSAPAAEPARAIEREDAADARADAARKELDDDLRARVEETIRADGKELRDAMENDFDDMLPPDRRVRRPDGGQ